MRLPSVACRSVQLLDVRRSDLHELHTVRISKCLLPSLPRTQLPTQTHRAVRPWTRFALPELPVLAQNPRLIREASAPEAYRLDFGLKKK